MINLSNRRKYTNKECNTTIIEIKDDDEIKNYLKIDDHIIYDIVNRKDMIYVYHYDWETIYMIKNEFGILTATLSIIEHIDQKENQDYN